MASVSSLDKDLRQLRLDKYTPQAANEVRTWIEEVLGERLKSGDLLEALKDGVALCRLVNHAISPGVKFKQSAMPFVQMENISHFLRACQSPPLSLPPHDVFLTVDLFESKDPTQVLQCISAFSRRANFINPSAFPHTIGAKSKGGVMSPQLTGSSQGGHGRPLSGLGTRERGISNVSDASSTTWNQSSKKADFATPTGTVSSWSTKTDEGNTAPAWNIHQYGYMGGASQGNQGVSFGARRQLTSATPSVPSFAEKQRRRKEEEAEAERLRLQAEEAESKRRKELQAEEERARAEEERRWEEETRKRREKERREAEEEKKKWDEEQRQWKEEEEMRLREEKEAEAQLASQREMVRGNSDARLNGQFLSAYQSDHGRKSRNVSGDVTRLTPEVQRIRDLERQLELAKERERQYELERQVKVATSLRYDGGNQQKRDRSRSRSLPRPEPKSKDEDESERDFLRKQWQSHNEPEVAQQQFPPKPPRPTIDEPRKKDAEQQQQAPAEPPRPAVEETPRRDAEQQQPPIKPPRPTIDEPPKRDTEQQQRPLPQPRHSTPSQLAPAQNTNSAPSSRPLPNPAEHAAGANRTDRYLTSNPAPAPAPPKSHRPADYSTTTEVDLENQRRKESQAKTKTGGSASKSLLEREMERERERQREWEEDQKETAQAARDYKEGSGPGQSWDIHQYGYMGGDNQNRGGPGLGVGGARRQIIGPRPPP